MLALVFVRFFTQATSPVLGLKLECAEVGVVPQRVILLAGWNNINNSSCIPDQLSLTFWLKHFKAPVKSLIPRPAIRIVPASNKKPHPFLKETPVTFLSYFTTEEPN